MNVADELRRTMSTPARSSPDPIVIGCACDATSADGKYVVGVTMMVPFDSSVAPYDAVVEFRTNRSVCGTIEPEPIGIPGAPAIMAARISGDMSAGGLDGAVLLANGTATMYSPGVRLASR